MAHEAKTKTHEDGMGTWGEGRGEGEDKCNQNVLPTFVNSSKNNFISFL